VNGLILVAFVSLVVLCYRGIGLLVVGRSSADIGEVILLVDDVSDSIDVDNGLSGESVAQIEAQVKEALDAARGDRKNRHTVLRVMSPGLYFAEDELLVASVNYMQDAEDLAVSCSQGEDTWDDLEGLRDKREEYVDSRDGYFSVTSSVRRKFLLDL